MARTQAAAIEVLSNSGRSASSAGAGPDVGMTPRIGN